MTDFSTVIVWKLPHSPGNLLAILFFLQEALDSWRTVMRNIAPVKQVPAAGITGYIFQAICLQFRAGENGMSFMFASKRKMYFVQDFL